MLIKKYIFFFYNLIFLIINIIILTNDSSFKLYKYLYSDKSNKVKHQNHKKIINIYCVDLYRGQNIEEMLVELLGSEFTFNFDENNPDYLIYNIFGVRHLEEKYKSCVKISYSTENKIPDISYADYSIGFHHINYLDRFFSSNFYYVTNYSFYQNIRVNVLRNPKRTKFCAAVITNAKSSFRNLFIEELNKYKIVDMGGNYKNNVGGKIEDKISFLEKYKFSIAMENSEGDGYTTEKINQSFIAGTIPIYYGNYLIDEIYNPKSIIIIDLVLSLKNIFL